MRGRWMVAVGLVAGCGGKREAEDYLVEFTDGYCAYYLECTDPAQLAFDGADSPEACVATNGPRFAEQWEGCALVQKNADRCLTFLQGSQCPADGDLDGGLPVECYTAWEKCIGGGTPGGPDAAE
jgi:hypothetical protein